MRDVFLYDALRTPRGKARAGGGLADFKPQELVRQLKVGLDERCGAADPDALILGCVGQFGSQGGNIALVSKLHAGIDDRAAAMTVNNYCVSGLSAISLAVAKIAAGDWDCALAGGVEMMSQAPFLGDGAAYYRDGSFPSRTRFMPVALAADRLARDENIDRAALDRAALISQQQAARAEETPGLSYSRLVVHDAEGAIALDREECIRPHTTRESLAAMSPAFGALAAEYAAALDGDEFAPLHTIGHAPPVCDGAGLALVGADGAARSPRARIVAIAEAGGDPAQSLTAGYAAMEKALIRAGMKLSDVGIIEFMESFGVTMVKFLRDYPVYPDRVNISGGHMAKGHALGATGAILASTLLDCMEHEGERYGLLVTTGASGAGVAMIVESILG